MNAIAKRLPDDYSASLGKIIIELGIDPQL